MAMQRTANPSNGGSTPSLTSNFFCGAIVYVVRIFGFQPKEEGSCPSGATKHLLTVEERRHTILSIVDGYPSW